MVVFLAGALAPPWTALLADLFPLKSCLQDDKEMHKYAVRRPACPGGCPRAVWAQSYNYNQTQ